MKILATFFILCAIFCTACDSNSVNYDAGKAAYKRGHYQAALYDFEQRAHQGDPDAQFCLGYMYKYGEGVKADDEEAIAWYTKAAQKGHALAQNNLAKMYDAGWFNSKGDRVYRDFKKAEELWKQAAEKDNRTAQANLGFAYLVVAYTAELNLEKDKELLYLEKAEEWLKRAAKQELPRASGYLGYLYMKKGREATDNEDFKSANKWYEMAENSTKTAAEKGYADAQNDLAGMYYNGEGVAQSLTENERWKEALKWYTKAADQGLASSQKSLAFMYYLGEGVTENPKKALELWKKAADQGNASAQNSLANIYARGEGMPKPNPEIASRLHLLAAQQGDSFAQYNIGKDFEIGRGVPQDNAEAYYWYGLALRDPDYLNSKNVYLDKSITGNFATKVTKWRENVGKKLPDEKHRSEIQERVDNWKPKDFSGGGTGFYIDKHHILTNAHVVTRKDDYGNRHEFDDFRIPYRRVELIDWDPDVDLALLYDKRANTNTAIFNNQLVDFGDGIASFGYPHSDVLSYRGNVTSGTISGLSGMLNLPYPGNYFQHTAPSQPGNSGGPVLDLMGNVVGVTKYGMPDEIRPGPTIISAQNVNFAIKFDVIQKFVKKNSITVNPITKDKDTENSDKINLQEIYAKARKFTVPVLCFDNKVEKPFEGLDGTSDVGIY